MFIKKTNKQSKTIGNDMNIFISFLGGGAGFDIDGARN